VPAKGLTLQADSIKIFDDKEKKLYDIGYRMTPHEFELSCGASGKKYLENIQVIG
jgi:hypothetical protein